MASKPSSPLLALDRTLWPAVALLAVTLVVFELTPLDLALQDQLYDFPARRWLAPERAQPWRWIFYTGPKVVVIAIGLGLLALLIAPQHRWPRRDLGAALLMIISLPVLIGGLKDVTNVFCPFEITRYGGDVDYVRVFESYAPGQRPARRGRGFPAAHASAGFALLGLAGLARTRRAQLAALACGLAAGAVLGGYRMATGGHYLSHTLVTGWLGWILFLVWRRVLRLNRAAASFRNTPRDRQPSRAGARSG